MINYDKREVIYPETEEELLASLQFLIQCFNKFQRKGQGYGDIIDALDNKVREVQLELKERKAEQVTFEEKLKIFEIKGSL